MHGAKHHIHQELEKKQGWVGKSTNQWMEHTFGVAEIGVLADLAPGHGLGLTTGGRGNPSSGSWVRAEASRLTARVSIGIGYLKDGGDWRSGRGLFRAGP